MVDALVSEQREESDIDLRELIDHDNCSDFMASNMKQTKILL
jgi:hypothetical protein